MKDFSEILGDITRDKFRQAMNRLLNECFLLKKKPETASDYRFVQMNADTFEGILDLLGYELIIRDDQGVITVSNQVGTGRIRFNKLESILLLILRLLYIEKMKELSQVENVIVTVEEIYDKYSLPGLTRPARALMSNALRTFKRYNLIKNLDRLDRTDPENRIQIYPSVLLAVTSQSLEEMYRIAEERLNEYGGGAEDGTEENGDEVTD